MGITHPVGICAKFLFLFLKGLFNLPNTTQEHIQQFAPDFIYCQNVTHAMSNKVGICIVKCIEKGWNWIPVAVLMFNVMTVKYFVSLTKNTF